MFKIFRSQSFAIGLAIFSMFFGAGNIVFPLAVGQYAGDKNLYAMAGLIITAAIMPAAGVIAMILFDGNYRQFFGRLGKVPGFILALIIISLLGPLGSTPRCIALSYTTLTSSFLEMSPTLFSALACGLIFLFCVKRNHLLTVLGWVLTPTLLGTLITIIVMGIFAGPQTAVVEHTEGAVFLHGLKEGYNTMDLLAAFFFSSTTLATLKMKSCHSVTSKSHMAIALRASLIGTLLLALIYMGFSYLASFHGAELGISGKDELLAAITMKVAGPQAGILTCVAIALACFTTAIALISAFTDFIHREVLAHKISYEWTLFWGLLLTFFISTFEFQGISAFLGPILEICYPGLIVLTALNIAYKIKEFQPIKLPVFAVFVVSAWMHFF